MKRALITIVAILVINAAVIFIIGRVYFPGNVAETSFDGGEESIKTRFYTADSESIKKNVRETIPTLTTYGSNWKIVEETENQNVYLIKAEIPVVIFTDDLEVKIQKADNLHETRIDVLSKSRVGQSDFGENARHIRKLLDALDKKFGKN